MREVALLAGVSHQTVSRVFNTPDAVRAPTRERVLHAVEALGYTRNLAARTLATQQSQLLGIIVAGSSFHGPSAALAHLERAARSAGWSTLVAAVGDSDDLDDVSTGFGERGVEAVVVIAPRVGVVDGVRGAAKAVPTVLLGDLADHQFSSVAVDQRGGARAMTRRVIDAGARRVVHLAGPLDWFDSRSRLAGWQDVMAEAGLDAREVVEGDWRGASGYDCSKRLLDEGLPDAVVCGNDAMAFGLIRGLTEGGARVGSDVLVTGFDDVEAAAWSTPSLTTVRQPFEDVGVRCMKSVLEAIGGGESTAVRVDAEVRLRESA